MILRMFGRSSGVMFELRRIILDQKWAGASLVLPYIYILDGLSSYYHEHILAKQVTYFQALLAREKELVAAKGKKKYLVTTYIEDGT